MNSQALQIAAQFDTDEWPEGLTLLQWGSDAAAELRRLHEVNEELVDALKKAEFVMDDCPMVSPHLIEAVAKARAAIAKAEAI